MRKSRDLRETVRGRRRRIPPAIALLLLSPMIGELLSGSAPPTEFFNPIAFVLLVSLYGSGAILMRELTLRWGRGYASLLCLGAAYGIIEEGLMVKSFFDPAWPDLGHLGVFGRWVGVNWVWAEMLTCYHAVFSIAIPVLLVELMYPSRRRDPWASDRALRGFGVVLAGVTFFGLFALTSYRPPIPQYASSMAATALLILVARKLPPDYGAHGTRRLPRPVFLWAVGLLSTVAFFMTFWALLFVLNSSVLVMLIGVLLMAGVSAFLMSYKWVGRIDVHKLSLCSGGLSFFILFAFLHELDKTEPATGMALVGLAFAMGLVLLRRRLAGAPQPEGR